MQQLFADIALPVPLDKTFTYIVPPDLSPLAQTGKRVLVPFGNKAFTGVIVGLPTTTVVKGLKPIKDILDDTPAFSEEMLALTKWVAEYYFTPWGEVLRAATPQGLSQESKKVVRLAAVHVDKLLAQTKHTAPSQFALLQILKDTQTLSVSILQKRSRVKTIHAALAEMKRRGWVTIEEEIEKPKIKPKTERLIIITQNGIEALEKPSLPAKQTDFLKLLQAELHAPQSVLSAAEFLKRHGVSLSTMNTLAKKGLIAFNAREVIRLSESEEPEPPQKFALNADQQAALQTVLNAVAAKTYKAFLLHGITGSGKTQVYIEAIRKVLDLGKTAIVLVPEISLTPQTVRRFKSHFAGDVAVMHSQMSTGERFDAWRLAHQGKVRIVIGPRSAIFAPLNNIGLIVVDEEHESSYKQFDAVPRYNARDVAIVRAMHAKAVVMLGSATPSIESYYNAQQAKYTLLELPQRVDTAQLPKVELVDMAKERRRQYEEIKEEVKRTESKFPKRLPDTSISKLLQQQIALRFEKKEGVILMQNRRGFSHVLECYDCGHVEQCDNCEVSLTFHSVKKHLRCHYCGFVKKPPTSCPQCHSTELRMHAFGTQQVQQELELLFPGKTIVRMDRDTTTHKGAHHRILDQFGAGKADILLGTQMVAKGLDFPRVTLVGVISADTQMLLPDFRASEGTFQLLTQVAGRAGRSNLAGEVIIQTLQPQHYSLKHVLTHDFQGFYKEELEYRRELQYPPFSRIVLLEMSGEREQEVQHHASQFAALLTQWNTNQCYIVLGPADAAIAKINNRFRKQIIIKDLKSKDPSGSILRAALMKAKQHYETSPLSAGKKIKLTIDIDPQGMM